MSPPRNYDDLRRTHEQVEAEQKLKPQRPPQLNSQNPLQDHQPKAEAARAAGNAHLTDEERDAQYVQNLRDKGRHSGLEIDHIQRKLENQSLVDQRAKEQSAELAEKSAKEHPSEDYFPLRDRGDRAFAALRGGEMTYHKPQQTEQLPGSHEEVSPENEKEERIARLLEDHHDNRKREEQVASSRDGSDRHESHGTGDMELTEKQRQRLDRMRDSGSSQREQSQDREDGASDLGRDDQGGGRTQGL
jgi:hypothetical protein